MGLGAHEEHVLDHAGLDHRARRGEAVDEARTLVADVEGGHELARVGEAQLGLKVDAVAGEAVLWGERGEHDHVEVGLLEAGTLEGHLGGVHGHVCRADAFRSEAAGMDTGAFLDPLVGGLDAVLACQIVVGDDPLGDVHAGA